ncbi:MAG: T9SS type A sorting domain-containing protein [Bacteroidales bacterium]|nr:T9SS type A sorting domain-containing protein [Bacteroidales bacterium]MCF8455274.1 T9SS type A sorting domain-containing protein [Bacteroidales bacterium]
MRNFVLKISLLTAIALFIIVCNVNAQEKSILKSTLAPGDIALDSGYINFQAWLDTAYFDDGFYSNRPVNQIMPVKFKGRVTNVGTSDQTGVSFSSEIHNTAGNLQYLGSDTIPELLVANNHWFNLTDPFTPPGQNRYHVSMSCNQDDTDLFPANNELDTVSFNISQNKVISRARFYNDNFSPDEYYGPGAGGLAGIYFYLVNTDTIYSISVYIDTATQGSVSLIGTIYEVVDSSFLEIISTDGSIVQPGSIGGWITLPVYIINPGSEVLEGGKEYLVGIEFYTMMGGELFIGTDTVGPHNYEIETSFRDSFGNPVNEIPMIEANFQPTYYDIANPSGNKANDLFKLYPNPVTDKLYIQASSAKTEEIKIFNVLGDDIPTTILENDNTFSLDMKEFPAGIYFVRLMIDGQEFTRKFVKE